MIPLSQTDREKLLEDVRELIRYVEGTLPTRMAATLDRLIAEWFRAREVWFEFVSPEKLCGLCANTGIIDTRGKVMSPAGVTTGVRAFCICPNGRALAAAGTASGELVEPGEKPAANSD